jgi:3-hydroxyacyl-CoA dehydrogenase
MTVSIRKEGSIAIVTMDNPPVNAIGTATREGLLEVAQILDKDEKISFIVLTGAGKIFAAGADAREFDLPPTEPHLPDIAKAIESASKPWVAAINGAALGGGLELALACRYRIAAPNASLGLPEVTLGLVPGAGGTQRLPRLTGIDQAVEMISTGKPLRANKALECGLVDSIAESVLSEALKLSLDKLDGITPVSKRQVEASATKAIDTAKANVAKRARLQKAPPIAISLVEQTLSVSFEEGMMAEREAFLELRQSSQASAMRHAFFAERGAKPPRNIAHLEPREITKAIVVGGGNMGASIAYAMDGIGIATTVIENDPEAAERARGNLRRLVDGALKRHKISDTQAKDQIERLNVVCGYENLPEAQLAIEAVYEDMETKKTVFKKLEKNLPPDAILASNTSYLDLNELAQSVFDPSRVIGLHFFSPAHIMKLLELIKGDATDDCVLATGYDLAKRLRKVPVLSGVCDGFIGNRLLSRYREIADMVMMDGAMPWEIDEAMVNFGYAMGPYEVQDLSGLDIAFANRQRNAEGRDPNRRYIPISDRMVAEGRLGRKTKAGWYDYSQDGKKQYDNVVEKLILDEAQKAGVTRENFTQSEIQTRLLYAMINEASAILEEGIAKSPSDIDLVLLHGYGFPRWRGGPMHYADEIGLDNILNQIREFEKQDPVVWKPNSLLVKLVVNKKPFTSLS